MIPMPDWELERLVYEERSQAAQRRRRNWVHVHARPVRVPRAVWAADQIRTTVAHVLLRAGAKLAIRHVGCPEFLKPEEIAR
jgi:hypothetical protein